MNPTEYQTQVNAPRAATAASAPHAGDDNSQTLRKFLLVGCERSGSTMLRLMLDHHPNLSCMYESDFITLHYPECRNRPVSHYAKRLAGDWHFRHSGLTVPPEADDFRNLVESFFLQRRASSGKATIGATIQHNFGCLPELFPDARYVHLLRDGRPVAASIMNMGWAGNLYGGAMRWRRTIEELLALQERIPADHWLDVRYEALLADSPGELGRICAFLGVPYSGDLLSYAEDTTYEVPDPVNADRWRKRLSPREIYLAEMAAGDMLRRAGYEPMFPAARLGPIETLFVRLHNRIGRGLFNCRRFGTWLTLTRKLGRLFGIRFSNLERRFEALRDAHVK